MDDDDTRGYTCFSNSNAIIIIIIKGNPDLVYLTIPITFAIPTRYIRRGKYDYEL